MWREEGASRNYCRFHRHATASSDGPPDTADHPREKEEGEEGKGGRKGGKREERHII